MYNYVNVKNSTAHKQELTEILWSGALAITRDFSVLTVVGSVWLLWCLWKDIKLMHIVKVQVCDIIEYILLIVVAIPYSQLVQNFGSRAVHNQSKCKVSSTNNFYPSWFMVLSSQSSNVFSAKIFSSHNMPKISMPPKSCASN